jgi:hypothetical protein
MEHDYYTFSIPIYLLPTFEASPPGHVTDIFATIQTASVSSINEGRRSGGE